MHWLTAESPSPAIIFRHKIWNCAKQVLKSNSIFYEERSFLWLKQKLKNTIVKPQFELIRAQVGHLSRLFTKLKRYIFFSSSVLCITIIQLSTTHRLSQHTRDIKPTSLWLWAYMALSKLWCLEVLLYCKNERSENFLLKNNVSAEVLSPCWVS